MLSIQGFRQNKKGLEEQSAVDTTKRKCQQIEHAVSAKENIVDKTPTLGIRRAIDLKTEGAYMKKVRLGRARLRNLRRSGLKIFNHIRKETQH